MGGRRNPLAALQLFTLLGWVLAMSQPCECSRSSGTTEDLSTAAVRKAMDEAVPL